MAKEYTKRIEYKGHFIEVFLGSDYFKITCTASNDYLNVMFSYLDDNPKEIIRCIGNSINNYKQAIDVVVDKATKKQTLLYELENYLESL